MRASHDSRYRVERSVVWSRAKTEDVRQQIVDMNVLEGLDLYVLSKSWSSSQENASHRWKVRRVSVNSPQSLSSVGSDIRVSRHRPALIGYPDDRRNSGVGAVMVARRDFGSAIDLEMRSSAQPCVNLVRGPGPRYQGNHWSQVNGRCLIGIDEIVQIDEVGGAERCHAVVRHDDQIYSRVQSSL